MTVKELIEELQKLDPQFVVATWNTVTYSNGNSRGAWMEVEFVDQNDDHGTVELS